MVDQKMPLLFVFLVYSLKCFHIDWICLFSCVFLAFVYMLLHLGYYTG